MCDIFKARELGDTTQGKSLRSLHARRYEFVKSKIRDLCAPAPLYRCPHIPIWCARNIVEFVKSKIRNFGVPAPDIAVLPHHFSMPAPLTTVRPLLSAPDDTLRAEEMVRLHLILVRPQYLSPPRKFCIMRA